MNIKQFDMIYITVLLTGLVIMLITYSFAFINGGSVTININSLGEMIFELILFGGLGLFCLIYTPFFIKRKVYQ